MNQSEFLKYLVKHDQDERKEYLTFVNSQMGGDFWVGAKAFVKLKGRDLDDIFDENQRLARFMGYDFKFQYFTEEDWSNYWLCAQHCDGDINFQKSAIKNIVKHLGKGNDYYEYLSDRVSCALIGEQKYGTQSFCEITRLNIFDKLG